MKIKRGHRNIGTYNEETNTYVKQVKASEHLFTSMNAWGIDGKTFTNILLPNNALIVLHECEEDQWYTICAEDLADKGTWLEFPPHGKQIFLETKLWN